MKVLIIHHLERKWERPYRERGTCFECLCLDAVKHIEENEYDKIILTKFNSIDFEFEHFDTGLFNYIDEIYEYGYGWDGEMCLEDKNWEDWTDGGMHSEYVYLAPWMRTLKNHDVYICGAFDGECLDDLEVALDALDIRYRKIMELVV